MGWGWWCWHSAKAAPGPGLQLHTAAHPGQLRRRFCLLSCYVDEAEAQRLNNLSKVTQLVRIRSEVWRLQKRGPWSLHRVPIWGSQACLLLPGETAHSPRVHGASRLAPLQSAPRAAARWLRSPAHRSPLRTFESSFPHPDRGWAPYRFYMLTCSPCSLFLGTLSLRQTDSYFDWYVHRESTYVI